jgi:hypothetical protein
VELHRLTGLTSPTPLIAGLDLSFLNFSGFLTNKAKTERIGAVRYRVAQLDIVLHQRLEAPQNVFLSEAEEDEWIVLNDSIPARHASVSKVSVLQLCGVFCVCGVFFKQTVLLCSRPTVWFCPS